MTTLSSNQRRSLAQEALRAASDLREDLGLCDFSPGCAFEAGETLGVSVRFTDINMEAFYARKPRPMILLSSKRPLGRRAFNAAHELGHHVFGHGSRLDELQKRETKNSWEDPDEFLADTFAGFFLMPLLAVNSAFRRRGWDAKTASPLQVFTVACDFGVGYNALVTHLAYGLSSISQSRARELKLTTPRDLRKKLFGQPIASQMLIAGPRREKEKIDIETGMLLAVPVGTVADTMHLVPTQSIMNATLFRAIEPGIASVRKQGWKATVRIQKQGFIGLAKYRHLEDA